jgi:hypothetical protein
MNTGAAEQFCVMIRDGTMDLATAYNRVSATLTGDNPPEDWTAIDSLGRIALSGNGGTSCDADPNRAQIEIEYRVGDYGCPPLSIPDQSCAIPEVQYMDGTSGHKEWRYFIVYVKTAHLNGAVALYHHVVNHETGHVLGLRDGGPQQPVPGPNPCQFSIMHPDYYGCNGTGGWPNNGQPEWPTSSDRTSVLSLLPYIGGGGAGGK